jgi:anaerobic selenocysteine-containing dehydrogenase
MTHSTHYRTCNLCEAMCGLAIEHDGREVLAIRGDEADVFSAGYLCPKAMALKDIHEDPDRLRAPRRRVKGSWQNCSWDDALEEVAERIDAIQRRYGNHAVGLYVGNPSVHNAGTLLFGIGFFKALRTFNRFSATSVDQLPHMLAALSMFGHQLLMPVPDIDRSDLLIMLGANPLVSNGSIMTAPGVKKRLTRLKRRGGRLVVIDPRRTETAAMADEHLFIRPGGDGLLLAAMARTLFEEKRVALGRLAAFTEGLERLEGALAAFSPERVAPAIGIDAATIRRLARELAATERAALYGRIGVCTQRFGGLASWLVNVVNVLSGHLDSVGGMMLTKPAVDLVSVAAALGEKGHYGRGKSRVRGLPEFGGEYPAATLADEIETPGDGQIRALVTLAGNPVLSTPNGKRLGRALEGLEFMASIDLYCNETTRHADIILPPLSPLEQGHYDLAFHAFAVRNTVKYSPPLFAPAASARADWQILLELTTRLLQKRGGPQALAARAARAALSRLGPEGALDLLLRTGPYGMRSRRRLSLRKVAAEAHGIDLGPLEPAFPERLYTKSGRIDLCPEIFVGDLPRLEAEITRPGERGLVLIGRRQLRTNNSWLHNSLRMVKGRDRCTLLMHPKDAASRGIGDGDQVRVQSKSGSVEAPVVLSDALMPGVVSLPHGFGHAGEGIELAVASRHPGVSINDVVVEEVDPLSGIAVLSGVSVEVERVLREVSHSSTASSRSAISPPEPPSLREGGSAQTPLTK